MTLATLTDKERADLLRDICILIGLNPETTTVEAIKERLALLDEWADRYEGLLK